MTSNDDSTDPVLNEIAKYRSEMREANRRIEAKLDAMSERLDQLINSLTMQDNVGELIQRIERLERDGARF